MDQRRWETIQRLFPERCRKRLNGDDDGEDDEYFVSTGKVSLRARKGPAWGRRVPMLRPMAGQAGANGRSIFDTFVFFSDAPASSWPEQILNMLF